MSCFYVLNKRDSPQTKVEVAKKPQQTITDLIKQHGRQPFSDANSKLNNSHFGDLLQVVEQYNMLIPLFEDFLSRTEIGFKKIKYTSLVKSLQNPDSQEAKNYYLDIIKRFLMIFIYYEQIFPVKCSYLLITAYLNSILIEFIYF